MIQFRSLASAILAICAVAGSSTTSQGQDFIGDALGQLIAPAIGPVIERAAGEIIVEGVRRGYENGRLIPPIRRGRPSPQPVPRPSPGPSPQPVPRPTPAPIVQPQPYPMPAPITYSTPYPEPTTVPREVSTVQPPSNQILTRPSVSPNLSPVDIALTHVVSTGSDFSLAVIQTEAAAITKQIDLALLRFVDQRLSEPEGVAFRNAYRSLLSTNRSDAARSELFSRYREELNQQPDDESLASVLTAADSADRIASLTADASHQTTMQTIDQLRDALVHLRGKVISGDDVAVLAERTKNLRNMSLLAEIARVLGVERREDLFERIEAAATKSEAPADAIAGILGMWVGAPEEMVADMQLPSGNPAVVLYNPEVNESPISFVCDDTLQITLGPGELVPFDRSFVVSFQNGVGSIKRYSIKGGLFRWAVDESGWDLRLKATVVVKLDASDSPVAFHYLLNGQPQVVDAGTVIEHRLEQPPRIDFDLGRGDASTKTTLVTPGTYDVAVNAETAGWDLLRQPPTESAESATTSSTARDHWIQSISQARKSVAAGPADAKVNALLDSIQ
jgi:hypothetical protein